MLLFLILSIDLARDCQGDKGKAHGRSPLQTEFALQQNQPVGFS